MDANTEELLRIGNEWLNENANGPICPDRSCVRCKLADALRGVERYIEHRAQPTNNETRG